MSKKFQISFKNVTRDMKILSAIQSIEENDRSRIIKDILFAILVEGKKYE
jgi:hypothetical protein